MPELDDTPISCGIRTLSGLCRDQARFRKEDQIPPATILLEAFGYDGDSYGYPSGDYKPQSAADLRFGIIIFSDSVRRGNGKRLAKFIEDNKLGKVVASDIITNPNTSRKIQMWTWYLNRAALVKWLKENGQIDIPERPVVGEWGARW